MDAAKDGNPCEDVSAWTLPLFSLCCRHEKERILRIEIYSGALIYQIKFIFSNNEEKVYGTQNGFKRAAFDLNEGEYVTSITTNCNYNDRNLLSIQFTANSGRSSPIYGQPNGLSVSKFESPADSNGIIALVFQDSDCRPGETKQQPFPLILLGVHVSYPSNKVILHELPCIIPPSTPSLVKLPQMKLGMLVKESKFRKQLNKRFIVLDNCQLTYYLDNDYPVNYPNNNTCTPRGQCDLHLYDLVSLNEELNDRTFTIRPKIGVGGLETYQFICESTNHQISWRNALAEHIESSRVPKL